MCKNDTFLMKMRSAKEKKPLVEYETIVKIGAWSVEKCCHLLLQRLKLKKEQKWYKSDKAQILFVFLTSFSKIPKKPIAFNLERKKIYLQLIRKPVVLLSVWSNQGQQSKQRIRTEQKNSSTFNETTVLKPLNL